MYSSCPIRAAVSKYYDMYFEPIICPLMIGKFANSEKM